MPTTVIEETTVAEAPEVVIAAEAPRVPEAPSGEPVLPSRAPAERTDAGPYATVLCCGYDHRSD